MFYRTDEHHGLKRNPFKALVVPRPIGWISSYSGEGVLNLAPFSYFNAVSDDPPIVFFSAGGHHTEGGVKDSARNAEETGEFVCNLVNWDLREKMNATSAHVARDVNEFELAGLTEVPSELVKPPRVKESPAHLECRYLHTVKLPRGKSGSQNSVVFGQVIGVHIDESVITDGFVDLAKLRPVGRLGYLDYCVVDEAFRMTRPD